MKKIICFVVFWLFFGSSLASADWVRGHWRDTNRDGVGDTYVQPHQRTNPNATVTDNYSYPGNYNPNTGKVTPVPQTPKPTIYDPFYEPRKTNRFYK